LQQQHEELAREIAVQKMHIVQERRVHVSPGRNMTLLFLKQCGSRRIREKLAIERRKRENISGRKAGYLMPRPSPSVEAYIPHRGVFPRPMVGAAFCGLLGANSGGDDEFLGAPPINLASALDSLLPVHEPPAPPCWKQL
jgi:hypothetical protein